MTTAIVAAVSLVFLALVLFIARRAVRLFVRLVLVGVILLAVLAGMIAFKWYGALNRSPQNGNRSSTTRRTPSR